MTVGAKGGAFLTMPHDWRHPSEFVSDDDEQPPPAVPQELRLAQPQSETDPSAQQLAAPPPYPDGPLGPRPRNKDPHP